MTGDLPLKRETSRPLFIQLTPLAVFAVLALLTLWVWHQQIDQQWSQLTRHTEDVCQQVSRRLQILVESRLQMASIFAQRWSNHEKRDFSPQRFNEFASVLIRDVPGYHSMRMTQLQLGAEWVVPRDVVSSWPSLGRARDQLAEEALRQDRLVLSAPFSNRRGDTSFFAVLPLQRYQELLGQLVVEFYSNELIGAGFQDQIDKEFDLRVTDNGVALFSFRRGAAAAVPQEVLQARRHFKISNRTWTVTMAPRKEIVAGLSWSRTSLSVLILGIFLSIGLSGLVHLLSVKINLYREARDLALMENAAREWAQQALSASESRYRSVFRSATDGLLVLDDTDTIVEANPAASLMHGYAQDDFIGKGIRSLIVPNDQPRYEEFRRQLQEFGTAHFDCMTQTSDGGTLEVEVHGSTFSYGGVPRVLAIITDVSELKHALQRHSILARKVLVAQEEERARVSRELHDELGQILTALHLELSWIKKQAPASEGQHYRNALEMVERAANELRRVCRGLRPPLLDDLGLEPAVQLLIEEFEERSRIKVDLTVQLEENEVPIAPEVSLSTYRVLQESLNNIMRHAEAKKVTVTLHGGGQDLQLSVYDDGRGFDASDGDVGHGSGITGMKERASLVDGMFEIHSEVFQGTRVSFRAPLKGSARRADDKNTRS